MLAGRPSFLEQLNHARTMKTLRYSDKQPVRKGDVFTAPRWGTCAVSVNLSTGERFDMLGQPTFGESDLIRRKPENITRARMAAEFRRLTPTT